MSDDPRGSNQQSEARVMMQYDANRKSTGVAYLLWFFLGTVGGHRFYLGETGTAIVMLILFFVGFATLFIPWIALGIWLLVDLFLIPKTVRELNLKLADRLS